MTIQRSSAAMILTAAAMLAMPLSAWSGDAVPGAQRAPAETGTLAKDAPSGTRAPDPASAPAPSATVIDPIVPPVKRVLPATPKTTTAPPAKSPIKEKPAAGSKTAPPKPGVTALDAGPGKDPANKKN